jgi:LCP family protein required for cell wall assembly
VSAVLVVAGVAVANRHIDDKIKSIKRVRLTLASPPPGGANYLIIGSDSRAFVSTPQDAAAFGSPSDTGTNTDTIMVAHVEPDARRTFVVSFPRDLMVNIPGQSGLGMINSAYGIGGPQLLIDTLQQNFGVEINHYLEVDFQTFREVVAAIGNVRVWIPGRVKDEYSGVSTPYGAGCYPLGPDAALGWVRSRHLLIEDPNGAIVDDDGTRWRLLDLRSDPDRIARQQMFMRKLAALAIHKSLADPFLAEDIANRVLKYLKADQQLSRNDVDALIRAFRTVDPNDPKAVDFTTLPWLPYQPDPNRLIADSANDGLILAALNTFGHGPSVAQVSPHDVAVTVADGAGTGLASSVTQALAKAGFHATLARPTTSAPVTESEIRYPPGQVLQAKALLDYVQDARLVPDDQHGKNVQLVLGKSFSSLTIPTISTATTPGPRTQQTPTGQPPVAIPPDSTTTTISQQEAACNA